MELFLIFVLFLLLPFHNALGGEPRYKFVKQTPRTIVFKVNWGFWFGSTGEQMTAIFNEIFTKSLSLCNKNAYAFSTRNNEGYRESDRKEPEILTHAYYRFFCADSALTAIKWFKNDPQGTDLNVNDPTLHIFGRDMRSPSGSGIKVDDFLSNLRKEEERRVQAKREEVERIARAKREEEERIARAKREEERKKEEESMVNGLLFFAYGSGFFINKEGYIVTNYHVVEGCNEIRFDIDGETKIAIIDGFDPNNDLAILKTNIKSKNFFPISNQDAKLTDELVTVGYPFAEMSSTVKITKGIVSSLAGIANDYSIMQMDAAVQPGNSGGPVLDMSGNIVGVVRYKLNYTLNKTESNTAKIPENVNFAIKSSVLKTFLKSNNKSFTKSISFGNYRNIGEKATKGTVFLTCWVTPNRKQQLLKDIKAGNVAKVLYEE